MNGLIVALLLLLLAVGIPVGFGLMVTAAISMWATGIPLLTMPVQMYSGMDSFTLLAIPLFILMGELMSATSIADRLIALASALVGWVRGGLSQVNVLTSMFMAEMSGSGVADAAAVSKIFVPGMERQGYPRAFAAAVTASSATLGIIIPPSIPAVLYGVTTNTSIRDLFIAGIVPGLILGGGFMIANYIFARRGDYPIDSRFEAARLGEALKRAAIPLLIPVLVIGGLIVGLFTPTEASGIGVFIALVFGVAVTRDLGAKQLYGVLVQTARQASIVMMLVGGSAVLGQVFANERIPQQLAGGLSTLTDDPVLMLLLINLLLIALGMILHATAAIIIVVPILLPLAQEIGIDPVHFGIIVCLNLGIGQQTPPVASIVLTVCSVTGVRLEDIMRYNKWYILVMFISLMIVSYVPFTALWFR